ncbi:MAG: hypothetical protein ACLQFR_06805 [Streptosporangiaceae bacterium]
MTTRARRAFGRRSAGMAPFPAIMVSLVVLVCALAACGASAGPPAGSMATQRLRIGPVTAAGTPAGGFRVTSSAATAMCEPGSEAIGQAYRCFAGNSIYDPCWAEKAATPTVLCLPYPWSRSEVRLRVRGQLGAIPSQGGPGLGEPWGVELAGGERCLLAQGAHSEFGGRVIDYYCSTRLWLLRGLGEHGLVWRASSVLMSKSGKLSRGPVEQIRIAWFGRPDIFQ